MLQSINTYDFLISHLVIRSAVKCKLIKANCFNDPSILQLRDATETLYLLITNN